MSISKVGLNLDKSSKNKIIGLPPESDFEGNKTPDHNTGSYIRSSLPVVKLRPMYPQLGGSGMQLYGLNGGQGVAKYNQILSEAGISSSNGTVLLAFLNDASISESFGVEYGDSKFEAAASMGSSVASELSYITGSDSLSASINKLGGKMSDSGGVGGMIGGSAMKLVGSGVGGLESLLNNVSGSRDVSNLLSGHKMDFPQIWKGSSYAPSYSLSVRLYNSNQNNNDSYIKNIVEPLGRILAFIVPIGDSGASTYNFPVLCSAYCPGLFMVKAGYISSVDVVKGGDSNDIGFTQRPGIVDVKITINSLFSTITSNDTSATGAMRPTLKDYISNMKGKVKFKAEEFKRADTVVSSNINNSNTSTIPTSRTSNADQARTSVLV